MLRGEYMAKIGIIYVSIHHKNTEKVVGFIGDKIGADMINIMQNKKLDISEYDTLILASGIYFNRFHKSILEYIQKTDLKRKRVIILYTCGMRYQDYAKSVKKLLIQKGSDYIGDVYCRGYDTFGILGKIGGIAKGHPTEDDMKKILEKIQQMV